jgi:hypothetical protein
MAFTHRQRFSPTTIFENPCSDSVSGRYGDQLYYPLGYSQHLLSVHGKKMLKIDCGYDNILDMGIIQINGKKSSQIAREYGVSPARVRQYAKNNALPYVGTEDAVDFYVFDEAAEQAFANRNRKSPGRPVVPKPPKVPGKPGRPRKEKPVDTGPNVPGWADMEKSSGGYYKAARQKRAAQERKDMKIENFHCGKITTIF